jgi:deazaflavin-dependent oxidoreductase (nitroreductase family)
MPLTGDYEPSSWPWVRDQVALYESSGGTEGLTLMDTGMPVIIVTNLGAASGRIRKIGLMRVEHHGAYCLVGSQGGAPTDPAWVANIKAQPLIELQDETVKQDMHTREITGDERATWWERSVAAYPPYADYQTKTTRLIPLFLAEPA